jgi:hypothetical protein
VSSADLIVGWACSTVVSLALGVLLGTWLCNRVVARALKAGCQHNLVGSHESTLGRYEDREVQENRRKLADLVPNADDLRDANKKITGLDDLKPGRWL